MGERTSMKQEMSDNRWIEHEKIILRIVGARLTSVQFVLNYLIIGFDEKGALTTLVWPEILDKGERFCFGMEAYRNKLCSLIEQTVESAAFENSETIAIYLSSGVELLIPLQTYQGQGERAILTGPKHFLFVF
jgi:hypothetical protein